MISAIRFSLTSLLLIGALQGSSSQGSEDQPDQDTTDPPEIQLSTDRALETLETGSAAERRGVAESACGQFGVLESDPGADPQSIQVIDRLRRYLRHEHDDWIAVLLLDEIDCYGDSIEPLFLDSLVSTSPNRRWRAYRWFAREEDPDALPFLESAWAREARPWVRIDLIKALARNHSTRFLQDFLDLAEGEDAYQASASIGALKSSRDERAIPLLVQLAEDSEVWRRKEAVEALEAWPDSPQALFSLLRASEDENPEVRSCALASLSRMQDDSRIAQRKTRDRRNPRCTFDRHPGGLSPDNPDAMRASPPPGMSSARCFVSPGVTGDPRFLWRVPRGSLLFILDHFESPEKSWVQIHGFVTSTFCWMPASQVLSTLEEESPEETNAILTRDFDVPRDFFDQVFSEMQEAGMVEIVEPGQELVGVSLHAQMGDPKEEDLVRRAFSSQQLLLSNNVFWMIENAYTRICDYSSMIVLAKEFGLEVKYCADSTDPEVEP